MFTIGVDLGQSADPSAIVAIETALEAKTHYVRHIESLPLGLRYTEQVERIVDVDERCRALGDTSLVFDASGVGRAVGDLLRTRVRGRPHAVTISGGTTETINGPFETVVPKRDLVGALEVVLEQKRFVIVRGLQGARDLRAELKAFNFALSASGHDSYGAASGAHDDLVLASSLAVWAAEKWVARGGRAPGARMKVYPRTPSARPAPDMWGGTKEPGTYELFFR
jgi:hypothetical protein